MVGPNQTAEAMAAQILNIPRPSNTPSAPGASGSNIRMRGELAGGFDLYNRPATNREAMPSNTTVPGASTSTLPQRPSMPSSQVPKNKNRRPGLHMLGPMETAVPRPVDPSRMAVDRNIHVMTKGRRTQARQWQEYRDIAPPPILPSIPEDSAPPPSSGSFVDDFFADVDTVGDDDIQDSDIGLAEDAAAGAAAAAAAERDLWDYEVEEYTAEEMFNTDGQPKDTAPGNARKSYMSSVRCHSLQVILKADHGAPRMTRCLYFARCPTKCSRLFSTRKPSR